MIRRVATALAARWGNEHDRPSNTARSNRARVGLVSRSSFSRSAKNIRNENLPTGQELEKKFADLLGVEQNKYNLRTLADELISHPSLNLYQILYELYTVRELQIYQSDILNLPWKRIYTTNYDDAVEFFCAQNNKRVSIFTHDDNKPKKLKDGSVIHLHGSIRKTKEGGVSEGLVLNEQSYVRQHFEQSL